VSVNSYFAHGRDVKCCHQCVCVSLCPLAYLGNHKNFCMLPVGVARSSGDSAVHYVLPVFADVDDGLFSNNGPNADTDSGVSNIANYLP